MSGDRACFGTGNRALLDVCVCVCLLTVCLGIGGSPDGLFVSASSLRMWSVLMYESYRPSPWRAEGTEMKQTNQCDNVESTQSATQDTLRDKGRE